MLSSNIKCTVFGFSLLWIGSTSCAKRIESAGQQSMRAATSKKKQMRMHPYLLDLFAQDSIATEYTAYTLLKDKPLDKPVNFLAVPWAVLINTKQLNRTPRMRIKGGFTVCQHIRFEVIIPYLKAIGIDTLFTPHAVKNKTYPITVLPFPHIPVNGVGPAKEKDILISFVGTPKTHPIRKKIFKIPQLPGVVLIPRTKWHFSANAKQQEIQKLEYQDILSRSRYSLCPRGAGPSTVRFWESLQAGAIPILCDHDMWLPDGFDWSACVLYVKPEQINDLYAIVMAIAPDRERAMAQLCVRAYRQFCGEQLISTIIRYYR